MRWFAALAGAAVALGLAAVAPSHAMTFQRLSAGDGDCQQRACVLATGDITPESSNAFDRFLRRERIDRGAVVILDSSGGDVLAALRMGRQIREAGLDTEVRAKGPGTAEGSCASACVYVLMGGVARTVRPGAKVGVHQVFGRGGELSNADSQALTALIAVHLKRCGGGIDLLIAALRTQPQDMHWLSSRELRGYAVVTGELERADADLAPLV